MRNCKQIFWHVTKYENQVGVADYLHSSVTNCLKRRGNILIRVFLQAALGTNPISLAAPGKNGDSFVLDMATTAVAVGKVRGKTL
jgi:hypothetical protein